MRDKIQTVMVGVTASLIASVACIFFVAMSTWSATAFPKAVLWQLPVILIIGAIIGLGGHYLRSPVILIAIGSSFGWFAGILSRAKLSPIIGDQSEPLQILFLVLEICIGITAGLLPSLLWGLQRMLRKPSHRF